MFRYSMTRPEVLKLSDTVPSSKSSEVVTSTVRIVQLHVGNVGALQLGHGLQVRFYISIPSNCACKPKPAILIFRTTRDGNYLFDDLQPALFAHRLGGKVGVASGAVPVAHGGLNGSILFLSLSLSFSLSLALARFLSRCLSCSLSLPLSFSTEGQTCGFGSIDTITPNCSATRCSR